MVERAIQTEHGATQLLGDRLRKRRVERGMRQEELAKAAGVSASYLSRIESGQREPSPPLLTDLANALETSTSYLTSGIDEQQAKRVRLALCEAEYRLGAGEPSEAATAFARLEAEAHDAGDADLVSQALLGRASALEVTGRLHDAIACLEPLRELSAPGSERWMRAVISLLRCYRETGDLNRAVDVGERALDALCGLGLRDSHDGVRVAVTLLSAYYERGDVSRATYLAEDAVARAERIGNPETLAAAYWNASQLASHEGDLSGALRYAERAVVLQGEGEDARLLARARVAYADVLLRQDDPDVASTLTLLDQAEEQLVAGLGTTVDLGNVFVERARAYLLVGDLGQATDCAERALTLFNDEPSLDCATAHALLGRAAALDGDRERALVKYRQAVAVLTGAGAGRRAAQLWTELGGFFDEAAETADSRDAYRAAAACLGVASTVSVGSAALLHAANASA